MSQRNDPTAETVFNHLVSRADEDGQVVTSGAAIASQLGQPKRTIQYAMQRLEQQGKVVATGYRNYVVVHLATLDDEV